MLPIVMMQWGAYFPFKSSPMRIETNFIGHLNEKPPNLNYANISVFHNRTILMQRILSALP